MIEGGRFPRAKVMNQTMIDQYLMKGLVNLVEHQAGEYLIGQAARAGAWPTGVNLSDTRVSGGTRNNVPFGIFPYGRTLVTVKKKYGWFHMYLLEQVVIFGWDVSGDGVRMKCLKQALNLVAERRMGGGKDPLRALRKAAEGA
jgi:hypothetical protein